jgi:hypothetical protein
MSTTKGGWARKPTEQELTTLRIRPDAIPASVSERNAELTLYHSWDESLVGIRHWDREAGAITFSTPSGHPPGAFIAHSEKARTFALWNVREGMTTPGQWYLDRDAGRVVYWPLPGEEADAVVAYAPTSTSVLRLEGTEESPVRDVLLRGLTVGLTTTPLVAGGFGALRFEGAIEGRHVERLRIDRVTVRWAGGQGIRLAGCRSVKVSGCTVQETGAGGLCLSGTDGTVERTCVHHIGRTYASALGLRVSGSDWRVRRNTLHHTPYTAINAGGQRLRFEHNRFHHIMEELDDGAAIYIFAGGTCELRGNYTHDLRDEQVHAYYLDERCTGCLVQGNVAENVCWPIHNHMATDCELKENVCVSSGRMRISFANCHGFVLTRNVFVCPGELVLAPSYTGVRRLRSNVFFSGEGRYRWEFHNRLPSLEPNETPTPILPGDSGSVVADIGCVCRSGKVSYGNPELAAQLGLKEIDVSAAGCGREAAG